MIEKTEHGTEHVLLNFLSIKAIQMKCRYAVYVAVYEISMFKVNLKKHEKKTNKAKK